MGSSEYEFGASHDSLKRMREVGQFELREVAVSRLGETRTVYFVASTESFGQKLAGFQKWFDSDRLVNKESSFFDYHFDRTVNSKWMERTIAWWSFKDDIMWSLNRPVAEELLYGLEHPAV